jgi:peptide/nickel transport system ATP-binding protein
MYAGQIIERGSAQEMVFDPVHPYSKGLMGSIIVPEEGTRDVKLEAIPGTPPNLKKPPEGCRFAARCKYAIPACTQGERSERIFDSNRMHRCIHSVEYLQERYKKEREERA